MIYITDSIYYFGDNKRINERWYNMVNKNKHTTATMTPEDANRVIKDVIDRAGLVVV